MRKIVPLQEIVYQNVDKRGYFANRVPTDIIQRQVLKAQEELGELARCVFDGQMPPLAELADVVIPMLVIAAEIDEGDLLGIILAKSTADIERGVRNGKT